MKKAKKLRKTDLYFLFCISCLACTYGAIGGNRKELIKAQEQRDRIVKLLMK